MNEESANIIEDDRNVSKEEEEISVSLINDDRFIILESTDKSIRLIGDDKQVQTNYIVIGEEGAEAECGWALIVVPNGTNPIATTQEETLTLTSGNNLLTITGNQSTDTIDFTLNQENISITESQISDLDHTDNSAIHDDIQNEISGILEKTSPHNDDILLMEDSQASYVKKKITIANLRSYTDEDAQDAVGGILDDGSTGEVVFSYDDNTPLISATVQDGEIDHNSLQNTHNLTSDIDHDNLTNFNSNEHFIKSDININDLGDIIISNPSDNEVLAYNNGTLQWINQTPSEAGLAESGHNHNLADLAEKSHASLTNITSDQHHAQSHDNTDHSTNYEPEFSKNTAFNKNFGTLGTEVCVGNDARLSDERTDGDAIHDNISGEIVIVTEKTTLVGNDEFLIEDSQATNVKKSAKISAIRITESQITDLGHYTTSDFTTDFAAESLANLNTRTHASLSDAPTDAHHNETHVLATTGPHSGTLPLTDLAVGTQGSIIRRGASDWEEYSLGTQNYFLMSGATDVAWTQLTEAHISDLTHTDTSALHVDVANEITAITLKASPVSGDEIIIEDSEADYVKKSITLGTLPTGNHGESSHTGDIMPGANQDLGTYYFDIGEITAPSNPGTNVRRIFCDSADGKLKVQTSGGSSISLEEQGGGVTFGSPTGNIDIGDSAIEGTSSDATRADHQHQFSAPGASYPVQIDIGDSQIDGTATTPARSDHGHAFPAPGTGYPEDVGDSESDGTATTPARSDHIHAHGSRTNSNAHRWNDLAANPDSVTFTIGKATPTSVVLGVGHNGTSAYCNTFYIADHVHSSTAGTGNQIDHANLSNILTDQHHAESHNIASHSDTTATGTELNTLTDGSNSDSLHVHSNIDDLNFGADSEVSISTGSIARTQTYHTVDAEGVGTTDDLDLISGGSDGDLIVLKPKIGNDITIRHNQNIGNANNILLSGDASILLDEDDDILVLMYSAELDTNGAWIEVGRGGRLISHDTIQGVSADDHHNESHALDSHTNPTSSIAMNSQKFTGLAAGTTNGDSVRYEQLHNQSHVLSGSDHTASGLTVGYVIRASSASTFTWAQLNHSDLNDDETNQHVDWASASAGTIHTDNYIEGGAGTDTTAIHDNVANEITAITPKTSLVTADEFILEDSEATYVKKAVTFGNIESSISLANLGTRTHASLSDAPTDAHHNESHVLATTGPHTGALPLTDLDSYAAQGDLIYGGASDWGVLSKGTTNYVLKAGATTISWGEVAATEVTATNWRMVHSDGTGKLIELSLSATSGQCLISQGSSSSPTWATRLVDVVDDTTPQLGGNLDLNEKCILIDPSLGSNLEYEGTVLELTVSALTVGQCVYVSGNNTGALADANAVGTMPAVGVYVGTNSVLTHGIIRQDTWTWTAGQRVYVGTDGNLTSTAPSGVGDYIQIMGIAVNADAVLIMPSLTEVKYK